MDTMPIGLRMLPFTDILVALDVAPHALTFLDAAAPFAVVHLAVTPFVVAVSVGTTLLEGASIGVATGVYLIPVAFPEVVLPVGPGLGQLRPPPTYCITPWPSRFFPLEGMT